jgi:hypothetical protein
MPNIAQRHDVDGRHEAGHDDFLCGSTTFYPAIDRPRAAGAQLR